MTKQHTTLILAFLSQSGPDGKAEEAAHPNPEKGYHNTLPETEIRLQNILDAVTTSTGQEEPLGKEQRKEEKPPMLMSFICACMQYGRDTSAESE